MFKFITTYIGTRGYYTASRVKPYWHGKLEWMLNKTDIKIISSKSNLMRQHKKIILISKYPSNIDLNLPECNAGWLSQLAKYHVKYFLAKIIQFSRIQLISASKWLKRFSMSPRVKMYLDTFRFNTELPIHHKNPSKVTGIK